MDNVELIDATVTAWIRGTPAGADLEEHAATLILALIGKFNRLERVTRATVAEEIAKSLEVEVAWQREKYGDGKDRAATGRLVGMEDALRIVREHRNL